jgi:HlyD family secretion protein
MNRKLIIGGIIAVGTIALIVVSIVKNSSSSPAFGGGSGTPVKVVTIEKGDISSYISSDGVVEEAEKAEVFFDTPLKVKQVLVKRGDTVKKGQKLLELDLDSLNSQLDTLRINRNTQELSLSSKTLDTEVERALSALNSAERNYNDAKRTYENNKILYESRAISKNELDMSEKAFIEADTGINGLGNARLNYQNALENRKNGKLTAEDNLKVTNLQIQELENTLSKIAAAAVSPMDGVMAEINVQEGAFTSSMQYAYKVINPDKLQVKAEIKEYDIKNVAPGQSVRITGDAIDKSEVVTGKVTSVSPVAVTNMTASGSETVIEVLIGIEGAGAILKPGLNVTCDISTVDKKGVLIAPMEAVTPDKDDNKLVYVVDPEKKVMIEKKVTLGINSDMNVEIMDGLKEGDLVVMNPLPTYKNGDRVRIQEN